jgi:serine/threonine protein kinase/tetratricopeptide (TPR) repeat protein
VVEAAKEFVGTERYLLRRRLGAGAMGVVYEAHDREMDKTVALKSLIHAEASHIYRFKKEFRTLADVSHPNLVALYEMTSDGKYWFFTMEMVRGSTFVQYVRPESVASLAKRNPSTSSEAETIEFDSSAVFTNAVLGIRALERSSRSRSEFVNESRLRPALFQLAEGVNHLHEIGKLHRDIKPSNVLVTNEGRVVILDFGLVEDIRPEPQESLLAGTPDYMSPEQASQSAIFQASDWYSVGVMLYEALTGVLPFTGRFFEVVSQKQSRIPIQPRELNPNLPRDLNDLCVRLLQREPAARPSGREILTVLSGGQTAPVLISEKENSRFVGREPQLAELHRAFAAVLAGSAISIYLHGEAGMGKSALAQAFLEQVALQKPETIVLQGRCYERESVPYKALDGVVDALSKQLALSPAAEVASLIPPNIAPLARVFPVMLQVDAIFDARTARAETADLITLRRQAFAALRELLMRIATRQPLIIYIDDLQWADSDSVFLLEDLLRPPNAPPLLLIACFRSEEIESQPFLKALLQRTAVESCREIVVNSLSAAEARELAEVIHSQAGGHNELIVDSIVREANGNPFLIEQLSRYALMSERAATSGLTLGDMLEERIKRLPDGSRQLLNALAVAGRPVDQDVAVKAAGLPETATNLLTDLRAAEFARSGGRGYSVELYHDRIGDTLASLLDLEERRQIHRRLARAIEARGFDDPEALYEHYLGAGDKDRAAWHAQAAGAKASAALAFDRAAAYYRRAIDLRPEASDLVELKICLAEALANAGRPADAAQEFLAAAKLSSSRAAIDLQQRAGAQLLMGGHIEDGLNVYQSVLETAGFKIPKGPKRALASLMLRRLWIRMRGLEFTERDTASIPEADLFRIDICWAIAAGLGAVDFIRSADFQSRHLLLALHAGEAYRVSRAISFEGAQAASRGGSASERAEVILRRAQELARTVDHPHATGMYLWARGIGAYLVGQWKKAADYCDLAAQVFRDECTGAFWELGMAQRFMLSALLYVGDLADVSRRVPALLGAALEQGNILAATDLRTRLNLIWLAADDPARARMEVIEAMKIWPRAGFHLQHYSSMLAMAQIELYTDDAEVAWKHVRGQYRELRESLLLRTQVLRVDSLYLQARTALAAAMHASSPSRRHSFLNTAERMAGRLAKERMPYADPLVSLIRAPIAVHTGNHDAAIILLSAAIDGFENTDMHLRAMAARRRLGQTLGGDRGRELIESADAWMLEQEIKKPEVMTRMLAPGWRD